MSHTQKWHKMAEVLVHDIEPQRPDTLGGHFCSLTGEPRDPLFVMRSSGGEC